MPALEMAQETGKLVSWKKNDGDAVKKGELLLEVETDKAVVEIEAAGDGILGGITAEVGAVVPVGQTIAWLLKPGEAVPAASAPTQTGRTGAASPTQTASPAATGTGAVGAAADAGPVRISPKARRLAKEHGVDVSRITGTGPGGEIVTEDVLAAKGSASSGASAAPGRRRRPPHHRPQGDHRRLHSRPSSAP
jgi:pyruvate dehydrogenase E2 component (dihydrolipoamide acetyltransferase)